MKHRIFVKLAVAATAGMYLPGVGCKPNDKRLTSMLSQTNADPPIDESTDSRLVNVAIA